MIRRPRGATRSDTLFPYATRFRALAFGPCAASRPVSGARQPRASPASDHARDTGPGRKSGARAAGALSLFAVLRAGERRMRRPQILNDQIDAFDLHPDFRARRDVE